MTSELLIKDKKKRILYRLRNATFIPTRKGGSEEKKKENKKKRSNTG